MSKASLVIRCMGGEAPRKALSTRISKPCASPACSCRSSTSRPSPSRTSVLRLALLQEGEVPVGQIEHRGIELVVAHDVALAPVRRDHAGAEPDDADAQRRRRPAGAAPGVMRDGQTQRARLVEAADGLHPALGALVLRALVDAGLLHDEARTAGCPRRLRAQPSRRRRNCARARPGRARGRARARSRRQGRRGNRAPPARRPPARASAPACALGVAQHQHEATAAITHSTSGCSK